MFSDEATPVDPPELQRLLDEEADGGLARGGASRSGLRRAPRPPSVAAPRPVPTPAPAAPRSTPPARRAAASSRLGQQLSHMLARRRSAVGLTIAQMSSLAGIPPAEIDAYEAGGRVPYDHLVVLARVLGIAFSDLPGFRADAGTPVQQAVRATTLSLAEPLHLIYHLIVGDDVFGGPVDALTGINEFVVEVGDHSLCTHFPKGSLLAFARPRGPASDDIVVAMHKPSSMLVLRQVRGSLLAGLVVEQPSYQIDRSWSVLGRLQLALYPTAETSKS